MSTKIYLSIDDGHPLDLKIAEILAKKNKKAIFYVPIKRPDRMLTKIQIRHLGSRFELGGHTYNHMDLTKISLNEAWNEINDGKRTLEDILGKKIQSFAFPYGHYNNSLVRLVKKAGFINCRSGRIINFHEFNDNDFLQHPNFQIYPHKLITDIGHCLKALDLYSFMRRMNHSKLNHLDLISQFNQSKKIHLWFHSKDLEDFNLWDFLIRSFRQ